MGTGKTIKDILKTQRKTIKQLSEDTGISINTLYSITKRDSTAVTYPTLMKIAASLGVDIIDLLPEDDRDNIQYQIDYLKSNFPEQDANEIKRFIVSDKVENLPSSAFFKAVDRADERVENSMEGFGNTFLRKELLSLFSALNRRGKIEAVLRLDELTQVDRFKENIEESNDYDLSEETDNE